MCVCACVRACVSVCAVMHVNDWMGLGDGGG